MNTLTSGQTLTASGCVTSNNNRFVLTFQTDGNLVVYDMATQPWTPLWNSQTAGSGAVRCIMQTDGNLVLYDAQNVSKWNSETDGHPGSWCQMQDDGNLVMHFGAGTLWDSQAASQGGRVYCVSLIGSNSSIVFSQTVRAQSLKRIEHIARNIMTEYNAGSIPEYRASRFRISLGAC